MELTRFEDVHLFYAEAEAYLVAHEAHHNLLLGLCARLVEQPEDYTEQPPYFAVVRDQGQIVAAALMTPPRNLLLARTRLDGALGWIASDLQGFSAPSGVLGAKPDSLMFARAWQERTGQPYRLATAECVYELDRVVPPQLVPGRLREVTAADRDFLVDWFHAFSREALHEDDREGSERSVDRRLRSALTSDFFWEDGEPVSLAAVFRGTPTGARIGPVYTPPEYRGRGYASACVAAASQRMLDEGRRFCFLFTDLSNPTSNHIYQEIGYRPVVDMDEYRFG